MSQKTIVLNFVSIIIKNDPRERQREFLDLSINNFYNILHKIAMEYIFPTVCSEN